MTNVSTVAAVLFTLAAAALGLVACGPLGPTDTSSSSTSSTSSSTGPETGADPTGTSTSGEGDGAPETDTGGSTGETGETETGGCDLSELVEPAGGQCPLGALPPHDCCEGVPVDPVTCVNAEGFACADARAFGDSWVCCV